jgi:hypothetical protein
MSVLIVAISYQESAVSSQKSGHSVTRKLVITDS